MAREHWSSRIGFVMAAAGSAIGLGTLWMFPFVTGENGGGLFISLYILCTLFIGFPIFIAELLIGRLAQKGAVHSFIALKGRDSFWKLAGYFGLAGASFMMSYYSVVAGWGLNYVFLSTQAFWRGRSQQEITAVFDLLLKSGDIQAFWHAIFLALSISVLYSGLQKGIEYWSRLMTSSLFVLLLCLLSYSVQLEGFSRALYFVFWPDFSKLSSGGVLEALGLSFFTLSLGQGVMLTFGSYMKKQEDIAKTAMIVVLMDIVVSLLIALMIFPMIFSFGFEPSAGPGLIFKVLPVVFSKMQADLLLATAFFALFVFTALTSSIALIEVIVVYVMEAFHFSRHRACLSVGGFLFLAGLPHCFDLFSNWTVLYGMSFFSVISMLVSNWILPIGGLLTSLFCGWAMPKKVLKEEFCQSGKGHILFYPWYLMIRFIAPIGTFLVLVDKAELLDLQEIVKIFLR